MSNFLRLPAFLQILFLSLADYSRDSTYLAGQHSFRMHFNSSAFLLSFFFCSISANPLPQAGQQGAPNSTQNAGSSRPANRHNLEVSSIQRYDTPTMRTTDAMKRLLGLHDVIASFDGTLPFAGFEHQGGLLHEKFEVLQLSQDLAAPVAALTNGEATNIILQMYDKVADQLYDHGKSNIGPFQWSVSDTLSSQKVRLARGIVEFLRVKPTQVPILERPGSSPRNSSNSR